MVFSDIWRVELGKNVDLLNDVVNLVLGILDVDDFNGYRLAVALVYTFVDFTETTPTYKWH
jgi:hypothetical protein